ncbi:uncharacterized protein LOC111315184 [Durio zibethinus]|uniref:Uncharacterized protein LOC111315184 n=1 Tax=Durio zibethinus TaxID=66656 RepID=A0A6P6B647_DURZI|nr:uncharacterized protein LOC111315184 [Durio zibethinus]
MIIQETIEPYEKAIDVINLGDGENKKEVKVGTSLSPIKRGKLKELLHEFVDLFIWSYQDTSRLSSNIIEHQLSLKLICKLVANIVPVLKKDEKVWICMDYRDLNRASLKDNFFFLRRIDTFVDNTAKHSIFSFMDSFSRYNQIKMAPSDMEETTVVTIWGMFCYKVMPFGLKNARATYQRAMEVKSFLRMLNYISYFISQLTSKCDPIFKETIDFVSHRAQPFYGVLGNEIKQYIFEKPSLLRAIKGSVIVEFLTERATNEHEPIKFNFPNEDLMNISQIEEGELIEKPWKMFFDRASNALRHRIGVVLISFN